VNTSRAAVSKADRVAAPRSDGFVTGCAWSVVMPIRSAPSRPGQISL
jgi:hypothetical protein